MSKRLRPLVLLGALVLLAGCGHADAPPEVPGSSLIRESEMLRTTPTSHEPPRREARVCDLGLEYARCKEGAP